MIEVWSKLEDLYARNSVMRVVTLVVQLFNLEFPIGSTMWLFLMRANIIHDQLLLMDISLQLAALILIQL